jgi:signal peptidase I
MESHEFIPLNSQNEPTGFEPRVELRVVTDLENIKSRKIPASITLAARFTDFLGEPTTDTGAITITTTIGELHHKVSGKKGETIELLPGEAVFSDNGEFPIELDLGNKFGKGTVTLKCDLGESEAKVALPALSGFAISEMLESIIYAFLVAIIIRIFFFQTFWIPSGSMEPTLFEGDRIIANKLVYRTRPPVRGEVIIFRVFQPPRRGMPGRLTMEEAIAAAQTLSNTGFQRLGQDGDQNPPHIEVQDYIKRVIGLPGDTVEVNNGEIYVNGEFLDENYETRAPNYNHYGPVTVPAGEVFVLGDNRANSQDSHVIGTVPIRNIEGRAEAVFWPPPRIGLIRQGHW